MSYPELEQPAEMSLMIQVHNVKTDPAALAQLKSRLEDIRVNHRDPSEAGFIRNLVLTDVGEVVNGAPQLSEAVLDLIVPYLPGGATPAFDNVFVGTVIEPCAEPAPTDTDCFTPGWSDYVRGIQSVAFRTAHLRNSLDIASQFVNRYPDAVAHWYISWEAFLPDLMRDITYAPDGTVLLDSIEHEAIRTAYLEYQTALVAGLRDIAPRSVLWSPAVQQPLEQISAEGQTSAVAANLSSYFSRLEQNVGTAAVWLTIQDTLGRCYVTGNSVATTIAWRDFIARHHSFADLSINAETFALGCGEAGWTSLATRERVRERLLEYDAQGVRLGPSFDLDRWYEATHQMPWPNP